MLREVISKHIKPRITSFQVTTTIATATADIGYGDVKATRSSDVRITQRHPFSRQSLHFMQQSIAAGYDCVLKNAGTTGRTSTFNFSTLTNSGGTGAEGTMEGFCFGWDSSDTNLTKAQRVTATFNAPRIIWGKITGSSGAVAIGSSDFGCTRTATGVYSITFKKAFGKTPIVKVTPISTSALSVAYLSNKTCYGCTITLSDQTPTNGDSDFYIVVMGSDSQSDAGRCRMPILSSQRKPRIVAGQVAVADGVPSINVGGATGGADFTSMTDNGTGDFSVTLTDIYKREPIILLSTYLQHAQVHSYSNGVLRFLIKDFSGNAKDQNGVTNIFIIGSDDASEY